MRAIRCILLLGLLWGVAVIGATCAPNPLSTGQINTNSMKLEVSTAGPTYLFEWNRSWGENDIAELAYAVTVNYQRHILMAGSKSNLGFVAEFNYTGVLLWNRTWTDPEWMVFRDIGVLPDGTICLLVQHSNSSTSWFFVGKVNRTDTIGIYELGRVWAYCLTIDNQSNIYVTGYIHLGEDKAFLQKYNSSNQLEWNITLNVPSAGTSVAVTPDGGVLLLYQYGVPFNVMKFDKNGTQLWNRTYSGFGEFCVASSIGVDAYSNIYVSGYRSIYLSPSKNDALLCKLNAMGSLLWNITWGGISHRNCEYVHHLAIDKLNNSYVTGYTSENGADAFVAKIDTAGAFQWEYTWGGNGTDTGDGIAVDSEGNIYNAGYSQPAELQLDAFLVKYGVDSDGDNLTDDLERYTYGTNATNPDSDGDTLPDGLERRLGLDPLNATDAWADFDGDGLNNRAEYWNGTGLWNPDSDGDGLSDGEEVLTCGTLPRVADTDGDGFTDGAEVAAGTDPLDPESYPTTCISGFSILVIVLVVGILVHWRLKLKFKIQ
jgi:hypothetical protein